MRVGVTGHRTYDEPELIAHRIADAVGDLASRSTPRSPLELWTSLAEGADRAVAHAVLDAGGTLVAVLPVCADDYRNDFADRASCQEFERLLTRSARVTVTGGAASGTRQAAYERAGLTIVESVEVLLAVWDGKPSRGRGGTAEIVAAARARGVDVNVIAVTRDDAPA